MTSSVLQNTGFVYHPADPRLGVFSLGYVALFAAFVFTFLVPGMVAYRFFRLRSHEVWAFVPLFSVLVSVELIYYLSLAVGYSRDTIILGFLALTAIYALVVYKRGEPIQPPKFLRFKQVKKTSLLLFAVIFLVALAVLVKSVWYPTKAASCLRGRTGRTPRSTTT